MRAVLAPIVLAALVTTACAAPARSNRSAEEGAAPAGAPVTTAPAKPKPAAAVARGPRVVLETVLGPITIRLRPDDAPKTCENFLKLVSQGFYAGLTVHRVVPGFVIQGGDPNSKNDNPFDDGQGGPGFTVPAEVKLKHIKGAVAMARMPDVVNRTRASNGSQFYIALRELQQLDGGYTVFGEVVSGWETIDKIVALADRKDIARTNENANPAKLALIKRAYVDSTSLAK
ncbi:MAG: peptidylprolyl isomerase [Candidatus Eisenbacteria bacterium]|nr:peptidylprolyl isomerase [Candidatus Eisenbacteria bacterium]